MLWKCRVSVLTRDLCHVSLREVTNTVFTRGDRRDDRRDDRTV